MSMRNVDVIRIHRATKKMIEKLRKGSSADKADADTLEHSFLPALSSFNATRIAKAMNGGETETRETMFKLVADVVGKPAAEQLTKSR